MATCVADIAAFLESRAPLALAEEWDNAGLQVGDTRQAVQSVVIALDVTSEAIETAQRVGAQMIISHHPLLFAPLKRLEANSLLYRLVAAGVSAYAAHTNLDKTAGGVNDTLAAVLGLSDVITKPDGFVRVGRLAQPMAPEAFACYVAERLGAAVRMTVGDTPVERVGLCGGSGGGELFGLAGEIDAYVTGEMKHHEWLTAREMGQTVVDAGHYGTEVVVTDTLARWLREAFPELTVTIHRGGSPYQTYA